MVSCAINGSILAVRGEGEYGTGEITAFRIDVFTDPDPARAWLQAQGAA